MPDFNTVKQLKFSGQHVVVAGGTQGIGASIALLCARLGATVAILGRNAKLGLEVLEKIAVEGTDKTLDHLFIPADLSTVAATNEAATKIKAWVGEDKVDYLYMCHGGPPSVLVAQTVDGIDDHFAVLVMSRFVLAYTLLEWGTVKPDGNIIFIASAGLGANTVDPDNIDGKGWSTIGRMMNSSAVIDCYTKEFNVRYPPVRVLHVYPGSVDTKLMLNSNVPWWLYYMTELVKLIPYRTRSPDQYATIDVWIAASDEARSQKNVLGWNEKAMAAKPARPALDDSVRQKVWDRLVSLTK